MSEDEEEILARITEVRNETLRLQKALLDVDLKISKKNEELAEHDILANYISINTPTLFEKVGRMFIETTSENFLEKHESDVIESSELERSRNFLTGSFSRSESSLREEAKAEPLYCLKRALVRHGTQTTSDWLVYNVPTGS